MTSFFTPSRGLPWVKEYCYVLDCMYGDSSEMRVFLDRRIPARFKALDHFPKRFMMPPTENRPCRA